MGLLFRCVTLKLIGCTRITNMYAKYMHAFVCFGHIARETVTSDVILMKYVSGAVYLKKPHKQNIKSVYNSR